MKTQSSPFKLFFQGVGREFRLLFKRKGWFQKRPKTRGPKVLTHDLAMRVNKAIGRSLPDNTSLTDLYDTVPHVEWDRFWCISLSQKERFAIAKLLGEFARYGEDVNITLLGSLRAYSAQQLYMKVPTVGVWGASWLLLAFSKE